jgi:hypothetical protein
MAVSREGLLPNLELLLGNGRADQGFQAQRRLSWMQGPGHHEVETGAD